MISSPVIGMTECGKWDKYTAWVQRSDPQLEIVKLSWKENNLHALDRCHGVVLTGGEDVHPKFYGAPEKVRELDPKEINEERDKFEFRVIESALKEELPILGICRGLQIVNVHLGGTLIPDIPSAGKPDHAKNEGYDRTHRINVLDDTLLQNIVKLRNGEVNSAHHQAAERIGRDLIASAVSEDGIIEGLEWGERDGKPFFLLVQWHPERMRDSEGPFTKNLLVEFTHTAAIRRQHAYNHTYPNR